MTRRQDDIGASKPDGKIKLEALSGCDLTGQTCTDLYDMHCHIGFCADPASVARELAARGVAGGLCCTSMPGEYAATAPQLAQCQGWHTGVGLHPWWVGELAEESIEKAACLVSREPCLVGEIGLDFGTKHESTRDLQLAAFTRMLEAVQPGSVLSLHAVRSADVVLDLLEERSLTKSCTCILHWFSGTSADLHRAVRAGCRFSAGILMLRSRRGREYARQLPLPQLLLETDFPDQTPRPARDTAAEMTDALHAACQQIASIRSLEAPTLAEQLNMNSTRILESLA